MAGEVEVQVKEYSCSFCGRTAAEAKRIIVGDGVSICDECVVTCVRVLAQRAQLLNFKGSA